MSTETTNKPSLLNPDFSGLWSVARIGDRKNWCDKICGTIVLSLYIYSWYASKLINLIEVYSVRYKKRIGGFLIPFFILFLFYINYTITAILLASMIIFPYLLPISAQPWIVRLYIQFGSAYFDGGCTQIVESKPSKCNLDESTQSMLAGVHPHGVFCLGFMLCCGMRFRALEDVNDKKIHIQFADKMAMHKNLQYRIPKPGFAVGYLCKAPIFNFFFSKLTGCLLPADNKNMKLVMKKGISVGILPGIKSNIF